MESGGGLFLASAEGGRAFWRGGDSWSVVIDDSKGFWFDHRDGVGGGIAQLVVHIRGGSHQDALRWIADFAGVKLDGEPATTEERRARIAERTQHARDKRDIVDARYWRRVLIDVIESELTLEKSKLFDPNEGEADCSLIRGYERTLRMLRGSEIQKLAEFRRWRSTLPKFTADLVRYGRALEVAEGRYLDQYLSRLETAGV